MSRPYFSSSIADLEALFEERGSDPRLLDALSKELVHRETQRAQKLKKRVDAVAPQRHRAPAGSRGAPKRPAPAQHQNLASKPSADGAREGSGGRPPAGRQDAIRAPMPPVTDKPQEVLAAWTALEVMAPATFRRPEQLAGGERRMVARVDADPLPWQRGEKAKPGTRLYYHVVLGTLDVGRSVEALLKVYADDRPERAGGSEYAALASILVDRNGRPVERDAVAVSSFAWGVPVALDGDLNELGRWKEQEERLRSGLQKVVVQDGPDGESLPLTKAAIQRGFSWLIAELGLPRDLVEEPWFALRAYTSFRSSDQPEPLLLNSFFLDDLARGRELAARNALPPGLRSYLQGRPRGRTDLLSDDEALEDVVSPSSFPPARWPAPGRHPLVLLQQAAVNIFADPSKSRDMLGINGPPGTGKTTLLRDIVADHVARRAEAMLAFSDPAQAFTNSGQRLRAGSGWIHLHALDASIKGFELLIASSNNKAVENVSAELPGKAAIAADVDLRYFRSLSDRLLGRESWGLIAAVLGNGKNRAHFKNTFWWDEEHALRRYLLEAAGSPQDIETPAGEGGSSNKRKPHIVSAESPPDGHAEGLRRWRDAKVRFQDALARSRSLLAKWELVRARTRVLPGIAAAAEERMRLWQSRPGFWSRLFRTRPYRLWCAGYAANGRRLRNALQSPCELPSPVLTKLTGCTARKIEPDLERELREIRALLAEATKLKAELGTRAVDDAFFCRAHAERQQTAPWLPDQVQRARDSVFIAAMELHRAFIDAAAKPLRHNLGALMSFFGGAAPKAEGVAKLLPDLWSSLFLVVPAVSTTFASVQRMLGALPPEALGCLIVDEAGQATPQATVGALLRAKRALVVGDPIQVPPVVTLPASLTRAICGRFGIDPDRFNAPGASAQTLADAASFYCAEFETEQGSRPVGAPLLVHRRCAQPMFDIANAVAYGGLMVHAKQAGPSPIRDTLGASGWYDVEGPAQDKFCAKEGELVIDLLRRLAWNQVEPDLFIVTPFVAVQDGLRRLVQDDPQLGEWLGDSRTWGFDRIGTIHTVQGREAEAVIFVLGAPRADQRGARGWAGAQPNLLNVAVTRAKEALYVVGSRRMWSDAGVFAKLAAYLPDRTLR